jgi:hypothetical protein
MFYSRRHRIAAQTEDILRGDHTLQGLNNDEDDAATFSVNTQRLQTELPADFLSQYLVISAGQFPASRMHQSSLINAASNKMIDSFQRSRGTVP